MNWSKVVTHPLGLAGFALFLIFGLLARLKRKDERRWVFPAAIGMAFVALIGGLGVAYLSQRSTSNIAVPQPNKMNPPAQIRSNQVIQQTTGQGSPQVQGVQGDVTITVDQSSGKAQKASNEQKQRKK